MNKVDCRHSKPGSAYTIMKECGLVMNFEELGIARKVKWRLGLEKLCVQF